MFRREVSAYYSILPHWAGLRFRQYSTAMAIFREIRTQSRQVISYTGRQFRWACISDDPDLPRLCYAPNT